MVKMTPSGMAQGLVKHCSCITSWQAKALTSERPLVSMFLDTWTTPVQYYEKFLINERQGHLGLDIASRFQGFRPIVC